MSYMRRVDGDERREEEEQLLQMQYARDANWSLRSKVIAILFIIIPIVTILALVLSGMSTSPFYLPIGPLLFAVTLGFLGVIIASIAFRMRDLKLLEQMGQREYKVGSIKISQKGAMVHIAAAAIFVVIFATLLPYAETVWLEEMMVAGQDYDVLTARPHDLKFQGNDAFDATVLKLEAEVSNGVEVEIFLGEMDQMKAAGEWDFEAARNASVEGGYANRTTSFDYDGKDLRRDSHYILRVYNPSDTDNASVKVRVNRHIKDDLTIGMFIITLLYLIVGIAWFAVLSVMKRPSQVREGPQERYGRHPDTRDLGPPDDRGRGPPRRDMYDDRRPPRRDMYDERGPPPARRSGPPPERRGREGAQLERRPGVAAAAAVPVVEMRPEPAPEKPVPKAKLATIKCPRCKLQFSFERTGGAQDIRCPNCGKTGKVGGKKKQAAAPAQRAPPAKVPEVAAAPPMAAERPKNRKNIRCPRCREMFPIDDKPRPFDIECPHCGKKGRLK